MATYFVTRHPGARDWAQTQNVKIDHVLEHLDVKNIGREDRVIGTLPVHLAAEICKRGGRYSHLSIDLPADMRGKPLSAEDMNAHGARLKDFQVRGTTKQKEQPPEHPPGEVLDSDSNTAKETVPRAFHALPNFRFLWQFGKPVLFGLLLILLILGLGKLGVLNLPVVFDDWASDWDPLIGIATLFIAALVWLGELHQDWLASLPCKLSVHFRYDKREVMRCERAELSSEADMRALGQQIGLQMVNEKLDFNVWEIKRKDGGVEQDSKGNRYRHHHITFKLSKLPALLKSLEDKQIRVLKSAEE